MTEKICKSRNVTLIIAVNPKFLNEIYFVLIPVLEWNEWVSIIECTQKCAGGRKTFIRTCDGPTCVGSPSKVENCNEHDSAHTYSCAQGKIIYM